MAQWHTPQSIVAEWRDARNIDSAQLAALLNASREQIVYFGWGELRTPEQIAAEGLPDRVRQAHLMQTRALWTASQVGGNDEQGMPGSTVTVRPMDWQVQNLLRPRRGLPGIG